MNGPSALLMNKGVPPTPRKARTGELTPPGINSWARAKRRADLSGCFSVETICLAIVKQTVSLRWCAARFLKHCRLPRPQTNSLLYQKDRFFEEYHHLASFP